MGLMCPVPGKQNAPILAIFHSFYRHAQKGPQLNAESMHLDLFFLGGFGRTAAAIKEHIL
jgi:hypothetical protein